MRLRKFDGETQPNPAAIAGAPLALGAASWAFSVAVGGLQGADIMAHPVALATYVLLLTGFAAVYVDLSPTKLGRWHRVRAALWAALLFIVGGGAILTLLAAPVVAFFFT